MDKPRQDKSAPLLSVTRTPYWDTMTLEFMFVVRICEAFRPKTMPSATIKESSSPLMALFEIEQSLTMLPRDEILIAELFETPGSVDKRVLLLTAKPETVNGPVESLPIRAMAAVWADPDHP
ncbi:MAG: hypothetical protein JW384_04338 [Nitrosomonadaceae bacterium]|nr:hypothetical protein [Nitrosomonadaceae bacterium]